MKHTLIKGKLMLHGKSLTILLSITNPTLQKRILIRESLVIGEESVDWEFLTTANLRIPY